MIGKLICLPHIEFAYKNSVSAATRLAPKEVYSGRFPRLPFATFHLSNISGHHSLDYVKKTGLLGASRRLPTPPQRPSPRATRPYRLPPRTPQLSTIHYPSRRASVRSWWLRLGVQYNTATEFAKAPYP